MSAPIDVAVVGRRGVGVTSVARALRSAGVAVREPDAGCDAETVVLVIAEVLKPEDRTALDDLLRTGTPVLIVLNKADVAGSGPGGPMGTAHRQATALRERTGLPVLPLAAPLADAAPGPHLVRALRDLAADPADLTSPDAFLAAAHPVPVEVRHELLHTLDRFGIAHAVTALSRGLDAEALPALLRRLSEVDAVVAALGAVAAPVRYRRARRAMARLRALAAEPSGGAVARFLAADATVIAMMAVAAEVMRAEGLAVADADDAGAQLRRARYWRHYSRGPVNALHRGCGADIARGSLRLLDSYGR